MFCPKCGNAGQEPDTYCRSCGEFLLDPTGNSYFLNKLLGRATPATQINVNLGISLLTVFACFFLIGFLNGHYDALLPRLTEAYRARAQVLCAALEEHLPQLKFAAPRGGSAVWLAAPEGTDMAAVRDRALVHGVVFDAGIDFFAAESAPRHHFRLGYSSIALDQIAPGVRALAACMREAGAA